MNFVCLGQASQGTGDLLRVAFLAGRVFGVVGAHSLPGGAKAAHLVLQYGEAQNNVDPGLEHAFQGQAPLAQPVAVDLHEAHVQGLAQG